MSEIVESDKNLIITVDCGNGDEIHFRKTSDGDLYIEIDEPWRGSTETGFGATCEVTICKDDVARLIEWLTK